MELKVFTIGKKVCEGCKKEFDENYPFDDCDVCGSKVFKKRIKL